MLSKFDRCGARTSREQWVLEPLDRRGVENVGRKTKLKETLKCCERLELAGSSGDERDTPLPLKGDKSRGSASVSQSCTLGAL